MRCTSSPRNPDTSSATAAGCWSVLGTEMAKPLSGTTYSTGRWRLHAELRLSQNSPSLHGSLAERHVGELVAVRHATGQLRPAHDVAGRLRASDGGDALAPRGTRLRHEVDLALAPMRRHLATARRRVLDRADGLHHDLRRRHAEPERQRLVAVVREEPVVRRSQQAGQRQPDRLVAGAGDLEEHPALLLHVDLAVVDGPRDAGEAEVVDQLVDREAAVRAVHSDLLFPVALLEDVTDPGQERRCVGAVHGSVVEREAEVPHRVHTDGPLAVGVLAARRAASSRRRWTGSPPAAD